MKLTLGVDSLIILNWFIESTHQVHGDCKGHIDGALALAQGAVISKSSGQKMNTKSSSETELVGVDDLLPEMLWTKYFIEAQGYGVEHNIIHQDNESTLRMLIMARNLAPRDRNTLRRNFSGKGLPRQR